MLYSGKKINILTFMLSEKKILIKTKNHTPPPSLQVKWSVPKVEISSDLRQGKLYGDRK